MDKTYFKDAYDIGENMGVLCGEGKSWCRVKEQRKKSMVAEIHSGKPLQRRC